MKLNKKLSFLAVTALAAVTALTSSCSDDKYWDEDGISGQGVTFDRKSMSATFKPGDQIPSPVFNVVVRRGSTSGTETVTVAGFTTDANGDYTVPLAANAPWTFPTKATFADGSDEAIIPVTLTTSDEGTYKFGLKITSTSSLALGANDLVALTVSISAGDPQPVWRSLGKGKLTMGFFTNPTWDAEVQVDDAEWPEGSKGYWGHYRIYNPFDATDEELAQGWPEGIEFYICPPGYSTDFWNTYATNPAGMPFSWGESETLTLALGKTYQVPIDLFGAGDAYDSFVSPIYLNSFDGNAAFAEAISVLGGWLMEPNPDATPGTDEFHGIPNAVGLGAFIMREQSGSGTSQFINSKQMNFIFPGGSLGDYSFELSYFGHTFNADKTQEYLDAEVKAIGTDCKDFVVGLVQTKNANAAIAVVQKLYEDRQKAEDPDAVPVPEGLYGYTETTITEGNSKTFRYQVPQESTDYVFVAFSLNEGAVAETSTVGVKFQSITEMGGEDANWEDMGIGQMTDDMLLQFYFEGGIIPDQYVIAYDVPVQKHKTEANMYRVLSPYSAEYFPIGLNDFEPGDEAMVIDATNPQCVKIPLFVAGSWPADNQTLEIMSYSYYLAENNVPDGAMINAGIAGTLVNGVVSFPAAVVASDGTMPSMMAVIPEANAQLISNKQGLFKVVLPTASKAARKVTAKSHKTLKITKKHAMTAKAAKMVGKRSEMKSASPKAARKTTFRVPMALPQQLR